MAVMAEERRIHGGSKVIDCRTNDCLNCAPAAVCSAIRAHTAAQPATRLAGLALDDAALRQKGGATTRLVRKNLFRRVGGRREAALCLGACAV